MTYLFILIFLLTVSDAYSQSKIYFVSPLGNDNHSGLSIKEAWKTLDKVNQVDFQPGDQILFETGNTWYGQLKPQGSGKEGKPIILSSYGDNAKPVINIGKAEGAGIRLTNQSWWEISNMEITSGAAPEVGIGRQGIVTVINGEGHNIHHIYVQNCYIHDIWGQLGGNTQYTGRNSCAILVEIQRESKNCTLNDVLVKNNRIERFDKVGIIVDGGKNDIVVSNNEMENLGGDGIIVGGSYKGIIEYNVVRRSCLRSGYPDLPGDNNWWPHTAAIWLHHCEETAMQYNEVYDTGREPRNGDGEAYDFDFGCKRCICQYNYSRNNHGLLLVMYDAVNNICRYNISQNDQTHLIQLQCNISEGNLIYNNVFYVDHGTSDLDFFFGDSGKKDKNKLGAKFYNNIFYATGQGRFRTVYTSGHAWERKFDEDVKSVNPVEIMYYNNCYFGPWKNGIPDDPAKLVADPMFVAPGTGSEGLASLGGYKLQFESPCINAGKLISEKKIHDCFGNNVDDGIPDIGVYEQIGSGAFAAPHNQKN